MARETEIERLVVRLVGDGSSYLTMLKQAQAEQNKTGQSMMSLNHQVQNMTQGVQGLGQSLTTELTAALGVTSALGTALKGLRLAAGEEANVIDFSTMLKSAEAGQRMIKDIQVFAAKTPLNQGDIQSAAKTLLQFGINGREVMPMLKQLGDVTGGDAQRFSQMALAMGQVASTGRLMGQDLLQMINAGFNPLQEMSRTSGKSMAQLKDDMEKGRITVDMVRKSFVTATSEGGAFFGLMEQRSKSASGLWSTMIDDIESFQREVGKSMITQLHLKEGMEGVSKTAQTLTAVFNDQPKALQTTAFAAVALAGTMGSLGILLPRIATGLTAVGTAAKGMTLGIVTNPFAWAAAATVGIAVLTDNLIRSKKEAEDLDRTLKNMGKGTKQFGDVTDAAADKMLGENDTTKIGKFIKYLEGVQQNTADELNDLKDHQRKGVTRLANTISGAVGGPQSNEFVIEKQRLKDLQTEYDNLDATLTKLRNRLLEVGEAKAKGFNEAESKKIMAPIYQEAEERFMEAQSDLREFVKKIKEDQAELAAHARQDWFFNEQLDKLAKKLIDAPVLMQKARAEWTAFKASQMGQEVRESLKSPEQKMADEQKRLGMILKENGITWQEYGKAVEAARNRILGAAAALTDATEAGTNAARVLLYSHFQMMNPTRGPVEVPKEWSDTFGAARGGPGPGDMGGRMDLGHVWAGDSRGGPVSQAVMDLVKTLKDAMTNGVQIGFVNMGGG